MDESSTFLGGTVDEDGNPVPLVNEQLARDLNDIAKSIGCAEGDGTYGSAPTEDNESIYTLLSAIHLMNKNQATALLAMEGKIDTLGTNNGVLEGKLDALETKLD